MPSPLRRCLASIAFLLASLPSLAAFHLWEITELYSNASGSLQFVELTAQFGGQQFVAGHTLVSSAPGNPNRVFTFPSDLPGDTTGKKMLIATAGFAAEAGVTPDFVIPDGFLFTNGGTLNFAEGFVILAHAALPLDGRLSLLANGTTAANSPTNFAGASGSVTVPNPPRLANISTRMQVLTGNDVMIGGFIIGGSESKTVVVRARGPSLVPFGIANALANPSLQLVRSSDQSTVATNDDWGAAPNAASVTASGFAPSNSLESAILVTLAPGAYTAIVSGAGGGTGVGIVEVFEVDVPDVPLVNISTRGQVLTGNDVMIGGFVIQGSGPQTVVVRARGPSLVPFGITNALANPSLQLVRSSDQSTVATNDNWGDAPNAAAIMASGFAPSDAQESAILVTLVPGAYTAIVTGVGGGTGVGIVEVFRQ